jgi:hypothetical protein
VTSQALSKRLYVPTRWDIEFTLEYADLLSVSGLTSLPEFWAFVLNTDTPLGRLPIVLAALPGERTRSDSLDLQKHPKTFNMTFHQKLKVSPMLLAEAI